MLGIVPALMVIAGPSPVTLPPILRHRSMVPALRSFAPMSPSVAALFGIQGATQEAQELTAATEGWTR